MEDQDKQPQTPAGSQAPGNGEPEDTGDTVRELAEGRTGLFRAIGKSRVWRENLRTRALVGLPALAGLLVVILLAPPVLLAVVAGASALFGYYEYVRMLGAGQGMQLPLASLLAGGGAVALGGVLGSAATLGGGLLVGVVIVTWRLWFHAPGERERDLAQGGAALAGLLLVPWLASHLALLVYLPGGPGLVAFLVLALTFNDTLAYLVGSLLGHTPLSPHTSPNKTVEGSLGGIAGGVLAGLVSWLWLGWGPEGFTLAAVLVLGGGLAVAGQAGDLLESKIKRLNQADDSGVFLPGHGGLLDRLDAFLLSGPLLYYLLLWLR